MPSIATEDEMNHLGTEESRLALLLGVAVVHLEACIRRRFDGPGIPYSAEDESYDRSVCDQIERSRLAVERGLVAKERVWERLGIFDRAIDWDHLASDSKLGDEIRDLINQLYSHHLRSTS